MERFCMTLGIPSWSGYRHISRGVVVVFVAVHAPAHLTVLYSPQDDAAYCSQDSLGPGGSKLSKKSLEALRDSSSPEGKASPSLNSQNPKTHTLTHLCISAPHVVSCVGALAALGVAMQALLLQILPPLSGQQRLTRLTAFLALGLASEAKNGGIKLWSRFSAFALQVAVSVPCQIHQQKKKHDDSCASTTLENVPFGHPDIGWFPGPYS
ncbi:hypothetical protein TrVGV298_011930 [Trichoderma virens]|nr:hypothetical protein TrVGV298_011930 [Trichoderma virens]